MPSYIWCTHCSERRDTSGRYTSPANSERDAAAWTAEHESGECIGGAMTLRREGPKMGDNRLTIELGREMAEYVAEALRAEYEREGDPRAINLAVLIDTALEVGEAEQRIGR